MNMITMMGLSLWRSYISGVLHGDGWCTNLSIGLRSADKDFAEAFAKALSSLFSLSAAIRMDERGYWLVRPRNQSGRFSHLRDSSVETESEKAMWLRGLFDSEGNANLCPSNVSAGSFNRRVSMYSTELETLRRAEAYLRDLKIETKDLRAMRSSASHKGKKTVYELKLKCGRENFVRFATVIGSNIQRKQSTLNAIPLSYKPDLAEHCRQAQKLGVLARKARRREDGRSY